MKIRISTITILSFALISPILTISSFLSLSAHAADCQLAACIDVYTQDGQIIIEGKKGSGPASKITPKPKPKVVKPKVVVPKVLKPIFPELFPRPTTAPKVTPKPKRIYPPKIKSTVKPTLKPKVENSVSLNDRLIKLLPTGGIAYQPEAEPLVNVPIFFWSDLPTQFSTRVSIVGEVVDVLLRPGFLWSFGDGTFLSTIDAGGPYPNGKITHTYRSPGIYPIILIQSWNGDFTHNGVTRAITGTVKRTVFAVVTVVIAPTRFIV
jgi:hypothetical protein